MYVHHSNMKFQSVQESLPLMLVSSINIKQHKSNQHNEIYNTHIIIYGNKGLESLLGFGEIGDAVLVLVLQPDTALPYALC